MDLQLEFQEILKVASIGESYEKNPIRMLELTVNNNTGDKDHKKILFTGAHHARELTSIQMNLYILLKMLYNYVNEDTETLVYMNTTSFYFIPYLNVDGFKYISQKFI